MRFGKRSDQSRNVDYEKKKKTGSRRGRGARSWRVGRQKSDRFFLNSARVAVDSPALRASVASGSFGTHKSTAPVLICRHSDLVPSGTIVEATSGNPLPLKRRPQAAGYFGQVE
jgi:hypothetical protein